MKRILLGLLVFGVALGGSSLYLLTDKIAAAGPDSQLYNIKLFSEWVQLKLPSSDQEKIALKLQFMQERLKELADLERTKSLTKENVAKIQKSYNLLADDLMNSLKQAAQDKMDAEKKALAEKAQSVIAKQQDSLKEILTKVPDSVKEPVGSFLGTIGDAYNRAVTIFQEN